MTIEEHCQKEDCKKPILEGEGRYRVYGLVYCTECGKTLNYLEVL